MLLWGLVAAVPIVLHLLKRRRRQTVAWPAMQFLLDAVQRRSRNIQLWQWLLLLARVAAVLLIAAALANPILRQAAPAPMRPPQTHVLVIDTSYSMMAIGASGETRFQTAIDRALEYCRSAAQGDRFAVVGMQVEQQVSDFAARRAIQIAGGFIGQYQRRFIYQGPRQCHALLFPA